LITVIFNATVPVPSIRIYTISISYWHIYVVRPHAHFFFVLGIEPLVLCMLGWVLYPWATPQTSVCRKSIICSPPVPMDAFLPSTCGTYLFLSVLSLFP
jgi:hypothetical protein